MFHYVKNVWGRRADILSRLLSLPAIKTLPVQVKHGVIFGSATLYRLALRRVTFIGVTGSTGKTTTKELIATVLSSRWRGHKNRGFSYEFSNLPFGIANTILQVSPRDNFCVQEIAAALHGKIIAFDRSLGLVKPQIGVVTNIGSDHLSAFRTLETTAAVKGKLITGLPKHGTAVLNADDPHVRAMKNTCKSKILTYGLGPDAMLRGENVQGRWPERLSFTVVYNEESHFVHTQLVGSHWVHCVLAALAVGLAMGVPLGIAAQAIQTVPPVKRRLCPVSYENGITCIWDNAKAPLWSIPPALEIMKEARAKRKIVVIGTISDYTGDSGKKYKSVAKQALAVAHHVIFIGPWAYKSLKAKRSPEDVSLQAFYSVETACEYLQALFKPGDLILFKGSINDRLEEINPMQTTVEKEVQLEGAADTVLYETEPTQGIVIPTSPAFHAPDSEQPIQAIVGLGNPGQQYQNTPHNVGKRVLELLAETFKGAWTQSDKMMLALIECHGKPVYLINPQTYMNKTGPALRQLCAQFKINSSECILVHDDIDLRLGIVRTRTQGGDGGHKGIRSIFDAFRTDSFHRVKIGVGRPAHKDQLAEYVLAEFSTTDRPVVEKGCVEAMRCVLEIIEGPSHSQLRMS